MQSFLIRFIFCTVSILATHSLSAFEIEEIFESSHCSDCSYGTLFSWGDGVRGTIDLNEPLVTDRPDFTEASSTVGAGVAQLEFGYTYFHSDDSTTKQDVHSMGEPLLRLGLIEDWLEFRMAIFPVDSTEKTAGVTDENSGLEDMYLGFKIGLTPQKGILPEMAIMPQMIVPIGSNGFTQDHTLPGVNLIYSWELTDCLSMAGSTQFNQALDDETDKEFTLWAQSWTFAYSLTDNLGAYTEWFAFMPDQADTAEVNHFFNGGFTYLINKDVQFDIRAGTGLNGQEEDFFVGTGLSIRYY